MPRFAKQPHCPASAVLVAYAAGTLSFLARENVTGHLAACEFCGAESSLLSRRAPASSETTESRDDAPPMPLALRLLAESRLADMHAAARVGERHAA